MIYGTDDGEYYLGKPTWQAKTLIACRELVYKTLNSNFSNDTIKNLESVIDHLDRLIEDSQDEEW